MLLRTYCQVILRWSFLRQSTELKSFQSMYRWFIRFARDLSHVGCFKVPTLSLAAGVPTGTSLATELRWNLEPRPRLSRNRKRLAEPTQRACKEVPAKPSVRFPPFPSQGIKKIVSVRWVRSNRLFATPMSANCQRSTLNAQRPTSNAQCRETKPAGPSRTGK